MDTINATSGILTASGLTADLLDIIATEIGDSTTINDLKPTSVLLNPIDLTAIRMSKANTSGVYHADPFAATPTQIHGVPLIATPAVATGTVYLVTGGFGTFYTLGGLDVKVGHTGDDLIYNRTTVVVEERVLPVVNRPGFITKITHTAA
ncbi:hypothetical protein G5V59_25675 [Nocardioides sp. W3-2-3]|uniref:hypothetical protein n=1 Tax=Nocardioides convexus TaxID=2712224 RepID=UPI002418801C|nr:hypothetical protein [Nocardioides convexus]NHA01891.1 hypothetical protein [Nocardioides convexus]